MKSIVCVGLHKSCHEHILLRYEYAVLGEKSLTCINDRHKVIFEERQSSSQVRHNHICALCQLDVPGIRVNESNRRRPVCLGNLLCDGDCRRCFEGVDSCGAQSCSHHGKESYPGTDFYNYRSRVHGSFERSRVRVHSDRICKHHCVCVIGIQRGILSHCLSDCDYTESYFTHAQMTSPSTDVICVRLELTNTEIALISAVAETDLHRITLAVVHGADGYLRVCRWRVQSR